MCVLCADLLVRERERERAINSSELFELFRPFLQKLDDRKSINALGTTRTHRTTIEQAVLNETKRKTANEHCYE